MSEYERLPSYDDVQALARREVGGPLAAVLDDTEAVVGRYVYFQREWHRTVAVLYAAACYLARRVGSFPYLNVTSAEPDAGKTTLGAILTVLIDGEMVGGGVSAAWLYRRLAEVAESGDTLPLVVDEVHNLFKLRSDSETRAVIAQVLHSGYRRVSGYVGRVDKVGNRQTAVKLPTYGPKILVGIGELPDELASRTLTITLVRARAGEVADELDDDAEQLDELRQLASQLRATVDDAVTDYHLHRRTGGWRRVGGDLANRERQVWRPLLAVATAAGPWWESRARAALDAYRGDRDPSDGHSSLVTDLAAVVGLTGTDEGPPPVDPIATAEGAMYPTMGLLDALKALDGRPWAGDDTRKALTRQRLGKLLAGYGLRSKQRWPVGGEKAVRGYLAGELEDVLARHLPPSPPGTSRESRENPSAPRLSGDPQVVRDPPSLTTRESSQTLGGQGISPLSRFEWVGDGGQAREAASEGTDNRRCRRCGKLLLTWPDGARTCLDCDAEEDAHA